MREKIIPFMSDTEIVDLVSYIDRNTEMLEIGGGNSTVFLSKIVKRLTTVEHNKDWASNIENMMRDSKADWNLYLIEPNFPQSYPFEPAAPGQFDNYVNFISNLSDIYDVILVDGRDRVRVAKACLGLLKKGGMLLVHDFWVRPKYFELLQTNGLELINDKNSHKLVEESKNSLVAFRRI